MIRAEYVAIVEGMSEGSNTVITQPKPFVDLEDMKTNREVPKYATLEGNYWWLDGTYENFPNNPENIGYMSAIQSDSNGDINVTLTREYDDQYASVGFTFDFDTNVDEYPTNVSISWYRDDILIDSETFSPDSAKYFMAKNVSGFNKIVVNFTKLKSPNHYLKIFNIYDGYIRKFSQDEISDISIIEQIEIDNSALPSNSIQMTLVNPQDLALMFQRSLPIKVYKNDVLIGDFFIENSKNNYYKTVYNIDASDYMNMLENQLYMGGFYNNVTASDLIADVLGQIPYELDSNIGNLVMNGYMKAQTKREALRQIAFATNAIIDTSRSNKIVIKKHPTVPINIPNSKIIGNSYNNNEFKRTTKYLLNETYYTSIEDETEIYNAVLTGTITLIFDQPYHNYTITGGSIISTGSNYAIISGNGSNVLLVGKQYEEHTIQYTKENTNVVSTDLSNEISYDISLKSNIDILAELKFVKSEISCDFKLTDEKVGDLVLINDQTARITSLNYNLVNGDIYASCSMEVYDE